MIACLVCAWIVLFLLRGLPVLDGQWSKHIIGFFIVYGAPSSRWHFGVLPF